MRKKRTRLPIGLRTIKTAVAVIIAMVIVDFFGTTPSKLIFAMLGAMAAVQPTFQESVESCLTQIVGVLFGALCGIVDIFIGGFAYAAAKWTSGILYDIYHCVGNFVIALFLFVPLRNLMQKLYARMRK